jgi:hypothetical protein
MKLCWLVMPLFLMTSAVADDGYPASWAALGDDQACSRSIAGVYENRGEMANVKVGERILPNLSDLLLQIPGDRIAANRADFVEISQRDSVLYVRALRGSEILSAAQYPQNSGSCKDGWLAIASASGMPNGTGNVVLGYGEASTMLRSQATVRSS